MDQLKKFLGLSSSKKKAKARTISANDVEDAPKNLYVYEEKEDIYFVGLLQKNTLKSWNSDVYKELNSKEREKIERVVGIQEQLDFDILFLDDNKTLYFNGSAAYTKSKFREIISTAKDFLSTLEKKEYNLSMFNDKKSTIALQKIASRYNISIRDKMHVLYSFKTLMMNILMEMKKFKRNTTVVFNENNRYYLGVIEKENGHKVDVFVKGKKLRYVNFYKFDLSLATIIKKERERKHDKGYENEQFFNQVVTVEVKGSATIPASTMYFDSEDLLTREELDDKYEGGVSKSSNAFVQDNGGVSKRGDGYFTFQRDNKFHLPPSANLRPRKKLTPEDQDIDQRLKGYLVKVKSWIDDVTFTIQACENNPAVCEKMGAASKISSMLSKNVRTLVEKEKSDCKKKEQMCEIRKRYAPFLDRFLRKALDLESIIKEYLKHHFSSYSSDIEDMFTKLNQDITQLDQIRQQIQIVMYSRDGGSSIKQMEQESETKQPRRRSSINNF